MNQFRRKLQKQSQHSGSSSIIFKMNYLYFLFLIEFHKHFILLENFLLILYFECSELLPSCF